MAFSWILLLLVTMVHTRATNKLKRAKKTQQKGEVHLISDSETAAENDEVDWDNLTDDDESMLVKPKQKDSSGSKGKASSGSKGKAPMDTGKAPMSAPTISVKRKRLARRFRLPRDVNINKPIVPDSPPRVEEVLVNTDRLRAFEHRECIGERHVNIEALRNHSPEFGNLIEQANLIQVCRFPETLGYCLYLVRTFYTNARHLQDDERSSKHFYTNIQGMTLKISPQLIGEVLGMESNISGTNFLKGRSLTNALWQTVIEGICLEGTQSDGKSVKSKQLRLEYRFLNFIACYNILPNLQTKVVRWERMLFLYLLGHPSEAVGLNMNIPYIIWKRMSRFVEHPHPSERLPFPLIIMRILKKFKIDITSTSYHHCWGMIDESTIVKSFHKLPHATSTPSASKKPCEDTSASPSQRIPETNDEASLASLYKQQEQLAKEQRRISEELEVITASQITLTKQVTSIKKLMQKLFSKMGYSTSEGSDSDD